MKTKYLISQFKKFAEATKLKIEHSHFENGYGSEYIMAKPGTIYLQFADPRIGKRAAVYLNLNKNGCVSNLSGYLTYNKFFEYLQTVSSEFKQEYKRYKKYYKF